MAIFNSYVSLPEGIWSPELADAETFDMLRCLTIPKDAKQT